ncbi:MAG: helix-turn-helix transcriptional regulator [Anaerolineales bacterium]|jgi:transcriptional regulator with XRE-family HTH domain
MFEKLIDQLRSDGPNLPNSLSTAVGDLIRKARISANMSQTDIAIKTYLKQYSISRIELGTRAETMEDLIYLCIALKKPISYFFPKH